MSVNFGYETLTKKPTQYLIAIHNFDAKIPFDITIRVQDRLKLVSIPEDSSWIEVHNVRTGEHGFIPHQYAVYENSLEQFSWYFGIIPRNEAENLLIKENAGTFLVRKSKNGNGYALSIKSEEEVVHYKIRAENKKYFISDNIVQNTLNNLINLYQNDCNNKLKLQQKLVIPCPKKAPEIYELSSKYGKNYEIDLDEIEIDSTPLCKGNFGEVYKGTWLGKDIAIKKLREFKIDDFDKEVKPLKMLQHENIIIMYGICTKSQPNYIIFEYMHKGSLLNLLRSDSKLNINQLINFAFQITNGMCYVHNKHIIHRDLAARNILIGDFNKLKIADFGLSRYLDTNCAYYVGTGTAFRWDAIECLSNRSKYTKKSDVWSFGVVVVELFTKGASPYNDLKDFNEVRDFLRNGKRLSQPENMTIDIYLKIKKCWNKHTESRPSFEDLMIFFNNLLEK